MLVPNKPKNWGLSLAGWGLLPLLILAGSLWYLQQEMPASGYVHVPLHRQAIATTLFADAETGLRSIDKGAPYSFLPFFDSWNQSLKLSTYLDTLLPHLGPLTGRAGQWVLQGEDKVVYWEFVGLHEALNEAEFLAALGPASFQVRKLPNGSLLAEPIGKVATTFALLHADVLAFSRDAVLLEELAEAATELEIERKLPTGKAYGLLVHLQAGKGIDTSATALPFYPLTRLGLQARTLVLVPDQENAEGLGMHGFAAHSLKALRWPTLLADRATGSKNLPDGWAVRIRQGLAGNNMLVTEVDSLEERRKELGKTLVSMELVLPPQQVGATQTYNLALTSNSLNRTYEIVNGKRNANGGSGTLPGIWPKALLSLPLPNSDSTYLARANANTLVLSNCVWPSSPVALSESNTKADLHIHYSIENQWQGISALAPSWLSSIQKRLPVTLSRFSYFDFYLVGDRVQVKLALNPAPALEPKTLTDKPYFTNLFNDELSVFGQVVGQPDVGYAVSKLGRLYFFWPGNLSFAQIQIDTTGLWVPPHRVQGEGYFWVAGHNYYQMDSLGHMPGGYPVHVPSGRPKEWLTYLLRPNGSTYFEGLINDTAKNQKLGRIGSPLSLAGEYLSKKTKGFVAEEDKVWEVHLNEKTYQIPNKNAGTLQTVGIDEMAGYAYALVSVTEDGLFNYQPLSKGVTFERQLYKPNPSAKFQIAKDVSGKALGVVRLSDETLTWYDLQTHKKWEVPAALPYAYTPRQTNAWSQALLATRRDTLAVFNILGKEVLPPLKAGSPKPLIFVEGTSSTSLAVPAGRELIWYQLRK